MFAFRFIRDSHGIQCDLKRSLYFNIWNSIIPSLKFDTCHLAIGRGHSKPTFLASIRQHYNGGFGNIRRERGELRLSQFWRLRRSAFFLRPLRQPEQGKWNSRNAESCHLSTKAPAFSSHFRNLQKLGPRGRNSFIPSSNFGALSSLIESFSLWR